MIGQFLSLEVSTPPPHSPQLGPCISEPLTNMVNPFSCRCLCTSCHPLLLKERGVFNTPGWVELLQLDPAKSHHHGAADVALPVAALPLIQRP